jgi:hypothetical protein
MLKIKLSKPHLVDRKYSVFIDRDIKRSFGSRRKAYDFITKVEQELNEALLFINESFCNLTTFYRTYFMADRDFRFKYQVENLFDSINNRLNYISSHTQSENYNSMISLSLSVCFESLTEVCELIDAKSINRYDMLTRRRIELQKKIIRQYVDSFESFKLRVIHEDILKSKTA